MRYMNRGNKATIALIVINVLAFFYSTSAQVNSDFMSEFGLTPNFWNGDYWQPLTSMFLHNGIFHLAMNMLSLYFIGQLVEFAVGSIKFLVIYFLSGLSGSALCLIFMAPNSVTVGASGAIFGLLGACVVFYRHEEGIYGQIIFWIAYNLIFTFINPGISWQGHIGGLIGGIIVSSLLSIPIGRRRNRALA